jgi:hypothetical protein
MAYYSSMTLTFALETSDTLILVAINLVLPSRIEILSSYSYTNGYSK